MQIADATGAYTGMNSLVAAAQANVQLAAQQGNGTEQNSQGEGENRRNPLAEAARTAPRIVEDRIDISRQAPGDVRPENLSVVRADALREAQLNRRFEEIQLRSEFREQVKFDLGLTDDVLAQASQPQRFMFERQIEDRLDQEVRQELVSRLVEEASSRPAAPPPVTGLTAATATGVLSESDLPRISIRA